MKNRFLLLGLLFVMITSFRCEKEKPTSACFKGKLAKKGICLNYTITLLEGNMDPALYEASWTDPNTGITYPKAFRLGSPCNFPTTLNEGDEFYFKIEQQSDDCIICQAFYPTPSKAVDIKVLSAPCP